MIQKIDGIEFKIKEPYDFGFLGEYGKVFKVLMIRTAVISALELTRTDKSICRYFRFYEVHGRAKICCHRFL